MNTQTELRQYLTILLHWAWLLILVAALAGIVAYTVSIKQSPIYQASTAILIDEAPGTVGNAEYQAILTSERRARTYAELLTTGPLLEAVIQELGLPKSPTSLRDAVNVRSLHDTQLIKVEVRDTDPQRAAQIANTLVAAFTEQTQQLQATRYEASKESLQEQMSILEQRIQQTESSLDALRENDTAARHQLETALAQYRQSYANLLQSYEQVRLAEAQTASNVVQIEPAVVPTRPVSPRLLLNTALAAIVGLLITVGLVFLKEALDDTVKNPDELAQQVSLPILGVIGRVRKLEQSQEQPQPVTVAQPRSPTAEAFRTLRTNLQFTGVDRALHTILVTSAFPQEGKSTVAVNLAAVLAQSGNQVVLVDADLRRPMLHRRLGLSNRSGLSELFVQPEIHLNGSVRTTEIEGVSVITSGKLPPNPAELVGSKKMTEILQQVQTKADVVVIDGPPIIPVTDAVVLAQQVDAVVLIVKAGDTTLAAAKQAVEQLHHVGANVVGLVVNAVPFGRSRYGYVYQGYSTYYHYDSADIDSKQFWAGVRRWLGRKPKPEQQEVDAHS